MICIEDYSSIIPVRAGKIVGVATHRGEYVIVACEYGLFKLWDDYETCQPVVSEAPNTPLGRALGELPQNIVNEALKGLGASDNVRDVQP